LHADNIIFDTYNMVFQDHLKTLNLIIFTNTHHTYRHHILITHLLELL